MSRIELIAELSTNAGGDMALSKEFIRRFADAGADWIKGQYTRVAHLRPTDPQYDWFKKCEMQDEQFAELKAETEQCGAKFLLTVYNAQDVPAVAKLSTEAIKVGSGEAGEAAFVQLVKTVWNRVLISDGIAHPLGCAHELLRCVSRYPAPHGLVPPNFSRTYGYGAYRGWSDHCIGVDSCEIAMIRGATVIEKHVQLPNQARPVKAFEATVSEFKHLRTFADDDPSKYIGRWQA